MKILYLENHATFAQQVVSHFLRSHHVVVVPILAAAREALISKNFDLVLCDYDLDDGKGDEFVREWWGSNRRKRREQRESLDVDGVSCFSAARVRDCLRQARR